MKTDTHNPASETKACEAGAPDKLKIDSNEAHWLLARRLHWKLEHVDPSYDGGDWDALPPCRQLAYHACVDHLLGRPDLVRAVLEQDCQLPPR